MPLCPPRQASTVAGQVCVLSLTNTLDLAIHPARDHEPHHPEIADERPKWIFETRGFIFLDDEMREPGECVADYEEQWKEIPAAGGEKPDEQNDSQRSAGKMQNAGQGF